MEASDASAQRGRILLVDDDRALGGYLRRVLLAGGFEVAHELDARTAMSRVQAEQWDLLMTDIELPGMSGLELLDRVREMAPDLPVAMLTGHPSVDYAVSALSCSAAEFLLKPVSADELVATASKLIEAARVARDRQREKVLAHPGRTPMTAGSRVRHREHQRERAESRRLASLDQLIGAFAHDLNNLLNVIVGYADFTAEQLNALAAADDRLVPVIADVEQVATAARQAIALTGQLLTRPETGVAGTEAAGTVQTYPAARHSDTATRSSSWSQRR